MIRGLKAVGVLGVEKPHLQHSDGRRLVGPDVVRAVALIGVVVINFHGYLIIRGGPRGDGAVDRFFDPWTGPLSTRFAATFVLVAGVGVTLLTRRAIGDPAAVRARRRTLVRRGFALYFGGLLLDLIWNGTILPFYGAMFVIAAALFTWRSRWVLALGLAAALAGAGLRWWQVQQRLDGGDTSWFFAPEVAPLKRLADVFVNGTHPLFPWLAFFCTGIVLGRLLRTDWWRPAAIGLGVTLFGTASAISVSIQPGPLATPLSSTDPFERGLLYTAERAGHRAHCVRRRVLAGRALRRERARRAAAPRRRDDADPLRRPCPRVQPRRRLAGLGRPDRARHGADVRRRLLDRRHRLRQLVPPPVRHRSRGVGVSHDRRLRPTAR